MWGVDMQLDMVIEEMAELTQAILKYKRARDKEQAISKIAEEHADVQIMLDQLAYMMSEHNRVDSKSYRDLKNEIKRMKVTRLVNRLDEAEINRCKQIAEMKKND